MRTTQKQLEGAVKHLNNVCGYPTETYTKMLDGRYEPNANVFHIEYAYGGCQLMQMSSKKGCTGVQHPGGRHFGFGTKRECLDSIQAVLAGITIAKEIAA